MSTRRCARCWGPTRARTQGPWPLEALLKGKEWIVRIVGQLNVSLQTTKRGGMENVQREFVSGSLVGRGTFPSEDT